MKGFQKGNSLGGRKKGSKGIKSLQWESIGDYLVQNGSEEFLKVLKGLADNEPEKYAELFLKVLEYFKPKRAREDGDGNSDTGDTIFITDGNREVAKKAIDKFLND